MSLPSCVDSLCNARLELMMLGIGTDASESKRLFVLSYLMSIEIVNNSPLLQALSCHYFMRCNVR